MIPLMPTNSFIRVYNAKPVDRKEKTLLVHAAGQNGNRRTDFH
jgi:hypothetical protein